MAHIETRDGTKLYVKKWGSGRPVIMMHGWPLSADSFDDQAMTIADAGMCAIAYDRRGFGRSEQPWSGYDYDTMSDDLADVIKSCDAKDATLVGFSMGGGEVARYMSRHKSKNVKQAALVSSVVPFMLKTADNLLGTPQSVFDEMTKGMKADRAYFFKGFFETFYGNGYFENAVSDEILQWSENVSMMASLKATLACAGAFSSTDFRPDLAAFKVPTLIIHGTADKTVPIDASGRAAAAGIKQSMLIEYQDAPHGLFATHKEQFTKDLLVFLNS